MQNTLTASNTGEIPKMTQQTIAVSFISSQLWNLGANELTIGFSALRTATNQHLGAKISKESFEGTLTLVNERSWRQHNCILTAIVICTGGLPGGRLFYLALKLGAISSYPQSNGERIRATEKLQRRVFTVAKSIFNQNSL